MATSSLTLFISSLSYLCLHLHCRLLSKPLATSTTSTAKVSTISGHIKHLEGHLLSISSWSISNIRCSSCWNISGSIKSIFSKMAATPSSQASQQMDINETEQQIIEDQPQPQASELEVPSSPWRAPASSLADLKPPISTSKYEKTAKIHLIDTIIYDTLSGDTSYHAPPSETIRRIYDSFGTIMVDGIGVTPTTSDFTLISLVHFMKQSAVHRSSMPWDLSHEKDPINIFTMLDDITYGKFISTGSII